MFEKIVLRTILGACGAGVVMGIGYVGYSIINSIREDNEWRRMMKSRRKAYNAIEEELIRRVREAQ